MRGKDTVDVGIAFFKRGKTRTRKLNNTVLAHFINKFVDKRRQTRQLRRNGDVPDVLDLCAEAVDGFEYSGSLAVGCMHLNEQQFTGSQFTLVELHNLDNVFQFGKLLFHLGYLVGFHIGNNRDTRIQRIFGFCDCQTCDIVAAAREKTDDTQQNACAVVHKGGKKKSF